MSISKEHFSSVAFLIDLNTQCLLFKRSYEKLEAAKIYWLNILNGINEGTKFSPLDIIAECTVCLSSMSAIKRVLHTQGSRRSDMLNRLLNEPLLPHIFTTKVRNSWEHHDERLDKLLKNLSVGDRLCDIHVSGKPPSDQSFTLKRFDPTTMSINFLDDIIELEPCLREIEDLITSINTAFKILQETDL